MTTLKINVFQLQVLATSKSQAVYWLSTTQTQATIIRLESYLADIFSNLTTD